MKKTIHFLIVLLVSWALTAQVSDNFDAYNSGDAPMGWTKYQTGSDDPGFVVTDAQANSLPNSLYHNDDDLATESTSWIVAPAYTSTGNDLLTFYYRQNYTPGYYNYSGVWYSTTGADPIANPGDWTEIQEFNDTFGYSEDTWTQFMHTFNLPAGTTIYVAFKYTGDWAHEFYIDDFSIDVAPACIDPSTLSAVSTSLTDAELSWMENGTATMWNIEYGPTGFTQGSGTMVSGVTSNPYALTGLTAGQEYDFYVQSDCGSNGTSNWVGPFTWKQWSQGDDCSVAIPLNVESDCASATPYTLDYANAVDLGHFSCDTYGSNNGKWFSFTAPSGGKVKLISSVSGGEFVLLDGCGGSEVLCDDAGTEYYITNLTAGQTYYLGYWKDAATSGTVDICLEELMYTPPVFSTSVVPDCNTAEFTVEINVTDFGGATSVTVSDDQGSASQQLSAPGIATFGPYAEGTSVTFTVTNDDDNNFSSSETVQYYCPPANDACSGAIDLTLNQTCTNTTGTNLGATDSGVAVPSCSYYNGGDVWFKVTAQSDTLIVETSSVSGSNITDTGLAIYTGDCNNLTEVACNDDGGSGYFSLIGMTATPGTTYYIRVFEYGNNAFGEFNICAYDPTLSAATLTSEEFSFYPNPAEGIINFNANGTLDNIRVTDITGKVLISESAHNSIDVSALRPGIYLLQVEMDGKKGTYRIIKR